ncbi:hypothetical protein BpHYR1_014649, partial [Brachionus plicatilis]
MKNLKFLTISALIIGCCFFSQTDALQCYVCASCSGTDVGDLVTCPAGSNNYCMNIFASALGVSTVQKTCSSACVET